MATQLRSLPRVMSRNRRKAIEAEIAGCLQRVELLIARLDREDAQFEDLEEDDHHGDPCDRGEPEEWRRDGFTAPRPIYGSDQTAGPVNIPSAQRAYHRHMHAM